MQPLVQSAINAARCGENNKALELCKQALAVNPNDVDAWLVVAAVVEQPERKRQCLNRVLSLDPSNQIARDELLQMDRIAMGAPLAQPVIAPVPLESPPSSVASSDSLSRAHYYPDPLRAKVELEQRESEKALSELKKKAFVFTGAPISGRIFNYFYVALLICARFLAAALKVSHSTSIAIWVFLILGWACFMALRTLLSAPKIELRDSGIHVSTLLTHSYVDWNDIASLESNSANRKLKLISNKGKSISLSSQVEDYPVAVEIIRLKRPDLFGGGISHAEGPSTLAAGQTQRTSMPAFAEAKTFKKSFFKLYSFTLVGILYCLLLTWVAAYATTSEHVNWDVINISVFLLTASVGGLFIVAPFFAVSAITIASNKLTVKKFFEETEVRAGEIKEIKMGPVQGRYGHGRNFVGIWLFDGRHYGVTGFTTGEDIIYGFLMNWWNAYRNR